MSMIAPWHRRCIGIVPPSQNKKLQSNAAQDLPRLCNVLADLLLEIPELLGLGSS